MFDEHFRIYDSRSRAWFAGWSRVTLRCLRKRKKKAIFNFQKSNYFWRSCSFAVTFRCSKFLNFIHLFFIIASLLIFHCLFIRHWINSQHKHFTVKLVKIFFSENVFIFSQFLFFPQKKNNFLLLCFFPVDPSYFSCSRF